MAVGNSVNDEIREQHDKMKGKTFKEKMAYFWEYYKIHTLVVILVIFAAGSFIHTQVTRKDTVMDAAFVNVYLSDEIDPVQMAADFCSYAEIDTEEYEAMIDSNMYINYESLDEYGMANVQKLMAMVSAQSLDVILTDTVYLEQNMESGMFTDLTDYLPGDVLSQYADRIYSYDVPDDDKGEIPIAIDIRDSKWLINEDMPAWFTIPAGCPNPENAEKFFEYMTQD